MAAVQCSVASLRIMGDDLLPDEVSRLLGRVPTHSEFKGQEITGRRSGHKRIAKAGMWRIEASRCEPEDLDGQVTEILALLSDDLTAWRSLSERYRIDLFCGLFLGSGNEGLSLSPPTLIALGCRGIELGLDIYGPDDENDTKPCE